MEKQNDRLIIISGLFIVLQLILDFIGTRWLTGPEITTFLVVAKGIKSLFLLLMIVVLFQRKVYLPLYGLFGLGILVFLGQLTLHGSWREIPWGEVSREWMLYGGGIIIAFFFQTLHRQGTSSKLTFMLYFTIGVILAVCFSVLLGILFDIPLFKTYRGGLRFGYTGVLHKSITATYFFIGSICLSYYYTYRQPKVRPWIFFVILCSSFIIGTKGIYLFNGFFFVYVCWVHQVYKKRLFYGIITLIGVVLVLFRDQIMTRLNSTYLLFQSIYQEHGWLTSLMSFRNEILKEKAVVYFEKWQGSNYLFGGKLWNQGLFEMSLVDLYVFCGGIGSICVVYLYYKGGLIHPKEKETKQYIFFCYLSILIISIFAGQLFVNFSSIFFILWVLFLINNGEIVKKID